MTAQEQQPLTITAEEYAARRVAARQVMAAGGLAALVVNSPENVYYLLGLNYRGYFAFGLLVLPLDGPPIMVTRAMERPTMEAQVPDCVHVGYGDGDDPALAAAKAIREAAGPGTTVGVQQDSMFLPMAVWQRVRTELTEVEVVDGSGIVERLRAVKSPAEIAHIRRAAVLSDRAMQAGIDAAADGVGEHEIAAAVYHAMLSGGGEYPAGIPGIRSAERIPQEHISWSTRRLRTGDTLFLELSASVGRYHAPLTRMVDVGPMAPGRLNMADIALAALAETRSKLRPGAVTGDVYAAWQRVVDEGLGHHDYRRHHCGYQIGIGFPPSWVGGGAVVGIRAGGDIVVEANMVFHLFSWLAGVGPSDFVISETALITADGCEVLTTTPRGPIALE